jgi:hypothetical protein
MLMVVVRFGRMARSLILPMIGANSAKGKEADSRGRPFEFKIGTGQVIKGWDQGLLEYVPPKVRG